MYGSHYSGQCTHIPKAVLSQLTLARRIVLGGNVCIWASPNEFWYVVPIYMWECCVEYAFQWYTRHSIHPEPEHQVPSPARYNTHVRPQSVYLHPCTICLTKQMMERLMMTHVKQPWEL